MSDTRTCTCHPDDSPPVPCARKYALHDCLKARIAELEAIIKAAPHSDSCCLEYVVVGAVDRDETRPHCNCWKSKVEQAQ